MNDLNLNSRILYDNVETENQRIQSEMPLKYLTDDINKARYLENPNMMDVNSETDLRMKPTRLNEIFRDNIFLTGTAPFKARNDGPIDSESDLIFGDNVDTGGCVRRDLMESNMFDHVFLDPFKLKTKEPNDNLNSIGTRTEYRNKCFK